MRGEEKDVLREGLRERKTASAVIACCQAEFFLHLFLCVFFCLFVSEGKEILKTLPHLTSLFFYENSLITKNNHWHDLPNLLFQFVVCMFRNGISELWIHSGSFFTLPFVVKYIHYLLL